MVKIHINIPENIRKELKLCAVSSGVSMNALVGDMIERYLSEIRKEVA